MATMSALGRQIASVALPSILVMELLGAVLATVAIYRAVKAPALVQSPAPTPC
jgi:hypothetical protein